MSISTIWKFGEVGLTLITSNVSPGSGHDASRGRVQGYVEVSDSARGRDPTNRAIVEEPEGAIRSGNDSVRFATSFDVCTADSEIGDIADAHS